MGRQKFIEKIDKVTGKVSFVFDENSCTFLDILQEIIHGQGLEHTPIAILLSALELVALPSSSSTLWIWSLAGI
jgi:hypothetical protein